MKLSEFKEFIVTRIQILIINIENTYNIETAYFWEKWGGIASTFIYTVTYLVFINVIFSNVTTFAGYSKNEILFLTFIGQITFYLAWSISLTNTKNLIENVNTGSLDLLLTKPVPTLFYLQTKTISVINLLRDGIPTLILISLSIEWSALHLNPILIACGIGTFIAGHIAFNGFQFLFALPVFWYGEAQNIFGISYSFIDSSVPYEGYPKSIRNGIAIIIPLILATQVTTSVILGKSDAITWLLISFIVAIFFSLLKRFGWKKALQNYSSASS